MNQSNFPISTSDPNMQAALQSLQNTVNTNATSPLCVVDQAPAPDSTQYQTTSGAATQIGPYSWTVNCKGGLVVFSSCLSATGTGFIQLLIDGAVVVSVAPGSAIVYSSVLSPGSHTFTLKFLASSGTVTVNPAGGTSATTIYELPENVQA